MVASFAIGSLTYLIANIRVRHRCSFAFEGLGGRVVQKLVIFTRGMPLDVDIAAWA